MNNLSKEFLFEVLGTAILMLFGISGCACSTFDHASTNLQCGFAYAFGVIIASIFAGPVSGAHINPAVTLSFSVIGKFKWRKLPLYFAGQYLGSFIGSFLAYSVYFESINGFEAKNNLTHHSKETAAIFITFPSEFTTLWPAIWDQVVSTALLIFAILFISEEITAPKLFQIFTIGFVVLTFIIGFNFNCGAILNPARDLSPRVLLWLVGGYHEYAFKPLGYTFWWAVGQIGPSLGAVIGAILYHYIFKMRKQYIEEQEIMNFSSNATSKTDMVHGKSIRSYNTTGSPSDSTASFPIRRAKLNHNNQSLQKHPPFNITSPLKSNR